MERRLSESEQELLDEKLSFDSWIDSCEELEDMEEK
jgi:hypothetical protein